MSRRKAYRPKSFEGSGRSGDTSANIYESMLMSPAFMDLSPRQRLLYVYMKAQYYGKRKPGKDYPDAPGLQGDDLFYFPMSTAEKYGIYSRMNHMRFYGDIKSLETHGFIKTVASGRITRKKTIYQFSGDWKEWNDSS